MRNLYLGIQFCREHPSQTDTQLIFFMSYNQSNDMAAVDFLHHENPLTLAGVEPETLVNGDRYRAMITNFFIPELSNHDVQELGFQQDGATCHTARATIVLLEDTFSDRLISRFGPMNWPPRSCDLTPLDYFL
ncbi:putative LOC100569746 [Trichonephila clavipes]|nr:putative LOC100569746 [Trichonephila clavipes]